MSEKLSTVGNSYPITCLLSNLYINNIITAQRYNQLETLLFSTDKQNQELAINIINSLTNGKITI